MVFEGLIQIFTTTTEICTHGQLHPGSYPRLPCSLRHPPTRRGISQACTSCVSVSAQLLLTATVWHQSVAPAPSIFGARSIQQVSCYTILSRFQLPWTLSCHLSTNTISGDLLGSTFGTLAGCLVHPTAPVLLTKSGPLQKLADHPCDGGKPSQW